ncbi:hemocyanin C chain-like [Homarus americanus]|uniref:Hemocyanin C chain-like 1 n=1 Tax=Homarus americanus TaxID=6706 RepID=A0A8J5JKX3_HOMAM|nr:hemocyanin C chain-like [Homarus americanus]KAG7157360.1 Hemocyanin C chain-like 1 [Homarus americanus]
MKVLVLCALAVVTAASSGFQSDSPPVSEVNVAQKQHDVNFLLFKVYEVLRDEHLKHLAETFDPEASSSHYTDDGHAAHALMKELKDGRLLEQKHWFSLFNTRQREEALLLYEVLEHSADWNTFAGNAAYFRNHMNEGEFVYALYTAVIHSHLTEHVVLPPLYEVTPHLFTNSEVIEQAYHAKMTQTRSKFRSDFTGSKRNPEQHVAYFGEDIGMNTHHVTWHMEFPFWWQDSVEGHHLDRKGENFFWVHHQLTVRFDAERLSNHLPPVEELHWKKTIKEGFAPHASYKYGGAFPSRPDNTDFDDVDGVAHVRDMVIIESRIRDAIAHGFITARDGSIIDIRDKDGIDILGDVIESSMYSPNSEYYGALHNTAHVMLGRQGDPHGKYDLPPGVLEHFETATRDPAFFRLHKYMDNIFREHKDSLTPYTKEELQFPGVKIDNLATSGLLETYFEDFEYSLLNAVDDTVEIDDVEISTIVPRLNHHDFTFNIDVINEHEEDVLATVRIFAWPVKDSNGVEFSFTDGRWNAIEMDKFWVKLHPRENHIVRRSRDSSVTVHDVPSFQYLMDRTEDALTDHTELDLHDFESALGLPNRFLLPKGNSKGLEFTLVAILTNGEADAAVENLHTNTKFNHYGYRGVYPDNQPHGYPLDRRVDDERIFTRLPNFKQVNVKVFNRS